MDPQPADPRALLDDYLALSVSLPALARRHNLALRALIEFLDHPETRRTLADLRRLAARRARDASIAARAVAIEALVLHATADPTSESARRAATELLRDRVRTRRARRAPRRPVSERHPTPRADRPNAIAPEVRAIIRLARARVRAAQRAPSPSTNRRLRARRESRAPPVNRAVTGAPT